MAVFLSLLFKNRWLMLMALLWATVNSYSRIYLGVHFLSDIVAGMIVGALIAFILYELYIQTRFRLYPIPNRQKRRSVYPLSHGNRLAGFIIIYLGLIIIFSQFLATLPH